MVDSGACMRGADIFATADDYVEDICLNPAYSSTPIDPDPYTGVPPAVDPLATLPNPTVPSSCDYDSDNNQISSNTVLNPATAIVPDI